MRPTQFCVFRKADKIRFTKFGKGAFGNRTVHVWFNVEIKMDRTVHMQVNTPESVVRSVNIELNKPEDMDRTVQKISISYNFVKECEKPKFEDFLVIFRGLKKAKSAGDLRVSSKHVKSRENIENTKDVEVLDMQTA